MPLISEAVKAGAEAPFVRPANISSDTASTWDVVRHSVSFLKKEENYSPDIIVLLQPTTPFRSEDIIDKCIENLISRQLDACISVTDVSYPPQWTYKINDNNLLTNFINKNKWPARRQDAEKLYKPNGMVYVLKLKCLKNKVPFPTSKMGYVYVDKNLSINIDEPMDVKLANIVWSELNDKTK